VLLLLADSATVLFDIEEIGREEDSVKRKLSVIS
jgi:hypothetical protein